MKYYLDRTFVAAALFLCPELAIAQVWTLAEPPVLQLGSVSGQGPQVFGAVAGATRLSSGAIAVGDAQAPDIRIFSPTGSLIARTGRRGDGPGEFQSIASVKRCAGDSIFVFDPLRARTTVIDPRGEVGRSFEVIPTLRLEGSPSGMACNHTGTLAFADRPRPQGPPQPGPRRPEGFISVLSQSGVGRIGPLPSHERYMVRTSDAPRPLGKSTHVAVGSSVIYVGTADRFEVAVYSPDGRRLRVIGDQINPIRISPSHIAQFIEAQVSHLEGDARQRQTTFYGELEYPEAFPAYADLLVDTDDNLWIREYPLPGVDRETWRVYSPAGAHLASVNMPARFSLLEVSTNVVLGVWRDEFDVQYVRVYALSK